MQIAKYFVVYLPNYEILTSGAKFSIFLIDFEENARRFKNRNQKFERKTLSLIKHIATSNYLTFQPIINKKSKNKTNIYFAKKSVNFLINI
jgi:hypothetical protein